VLYVLVVSSMELEADEDDNDIIVMRPSEFLRSSARYDLVVNVNNDYRYMKTGYYVSLHAEVLNSRVIPLTRDILDAYRTPILLTRASKAGVPVLPYVVTDSVEQVVSTLNLPVVVFAVNPFMFGRFKIARSKASLYRAVKSLTMNHRYAVCVQPLIGDLTAYKSFFGRSTVDDEEVCGVSKKVYDVFNIPICKLLVQRVNGKAYLCDLQVLRADEITPSDLEIITLEILQIPRRPV